MTYAPTGLRHEEQLDARNENVEQAIDIKCQKGCAESEASLPLPDVPGEMSGGWLLSKTHKRRHFMIWLQMLRQVLSVAGEHNKVAQTEKKPMFMIVTC